MTRTMLGSSLVPDDAASPSEAGLGLRLVEAVAAVPRDPASVAAAAHELLAAFELPPLSDYPPESIRSPTTEQAEQIAWLGSLIVARAQHELPEMPAFPALAVRILKILDERDPHLPTLIAAIHEDPMVSGQVLRMANSAFYSRGIEITTLREAAVRLGLRSIAGVAVAAASRAVLNDEEYKYRAAFREQWTQQWRSALSTAYGARWLSAWLHRGVPEHAFLGGLLHNIGKVVALRVAGVMVQHGDMPLVMPPVVLEGVLESAHVELGRMLALEWGLPGFVQSVCAEHHAENLEAVPANEVTHLVRLAAGLYEARTNPCHPRALPAEVLQSADALKLEAEPLLEVAMRLKRLGSPAPVRG
jgi:HD-like signal output (HDOD) protein